MSGLLVPSTFIHAKTRTELDQAVTEELGVRQQNLKFGVISDLHYDLMHDGDRRAQCFIDAMIREQPDFIISLGDFCVPKPANKKLMAIWAQFKGKKHYVLGNHDTDGGFTKQQALAFWDATSPYYSFDNKDFHFVVLDGNEKDLNNRIEGYARTIGKEQLTWLKQDLQQTKLRTVIFCHQGLENTMNGLDNGMQVRYLLEQINNEAGFNKIILVLTGHHHLNYHNQINEIHYVQINSSSYYWAGETFESKAFDAAFYKDHSILKRALVYQDPIWATVSIAKTDIIIQGTETVMAGIPLNQTGIDIYKDVYPITSKVDSRKLMY
ncbi:alkaline phosphatase [Sphingobacterium sp. Ag1]|nr:alkaline phosphatase [Sphingobacterium sp. Ag1]